MEYRKLGATGTDVSEICFGTWRFANETDGTVETDRETAHDLLDACHDLGINFIDTANVYGDPSGTSEEWIGEWLADRDREDFVIASKVYFPFRGGGPNRAGLGRKHIRDQVEGTLDRLGTDYLDVYYIHRWDEETPIEETMEALTALKREGTVNHLGASSMAAWKLTKALWTSDAEDFASFEVTQPRYNAVYREAVADYLDVCADQDLAVCPYSPLEGGFLTGKYERTGNGEVLGPEGSRGDLQDWGNHFEDRQWETLAAIRAVAGDLDATPAQVSLAWLVAREAFACVPIVGARTVEQLEENAGAVGLDLDDDQLARIDEAYGES
ncbi:MAG: aldo/keto reductase [Halobacteriales archaeon]